MTSLGTNDSVIGGKNAAVISSSSSVPVRTTRHINHTIGEDKLAVNDGDPNPSAHQVPRTPTKYEDMYAFR